MATYTDNYNLVKPTMAETADIRTINGNMDTIDDILHASQVSLAPAYDANSTYNTGDVVMYELLMYECLEDEVTGVWDATKWQRTTAGEHGGGGGGSNVEITPTLQSGTKIADFEIDGVSGALYAPSGGGGGSSQTIADVLWSGSETPRSGSPYIATLNHSIQDYDFIIFDGIETDYSQRLKYILDAQNIVTNEVYIQDGDGDSGFVITFLNDTSIKLEAYQSSHATTYTKITGLKFCGTLAPMIYSTEEREVGVWVDDKPLYQKSIIANYTSGVSSGTHVVENIADIKIVNGFGSYVESSGYVYTMPYAEGTGTSFYYYDGDVVLSIGSSVNFASGTLYLTIQYTKDSDVAGSGSYGSLGVPMEHYDDTERVIGTYFGETLYAKSYDIDNPSNNSSIITEDFSNKIITAITATGIRASDGAIIPLQFTTTSNWIRVYAGTVYGGIYLESNIAISNIKITVKYTKSST